MFVADSDLDAIKRNQLWMPYTDHEGLYTCTDIRLKIMTSAFSCIKQRLFVMYFHPETQE